MSENLLGTYLLPARVADPRPAIVRAQAAEEFGSLCGAVGYAVEANGGDTGALVRFREQPTLAALAGGLADQAFTKEQFVEVRGGACLTSGSPAALWWVPPTAWQRGSASTCRPGPTRSVVHGTTPDRIGLWPRPSTGKR